MKTTTTAAERALDQALREDVGGEKPPDLIAQVRERAERGDWPADSRYWLS